jgi:hypothetical protein
MAIKLIIEENHQRFLLSEHELDQSLITFGRSKSCHIELDHPDVSRRHFIIKYVGNHYIITDEGSRHGTMLDGDLLEALEMRIIEKEHVIEVPGFRINLLCDGQKPKLERTTVVARQLLDELLQNGISPQECPSLHSKDGKYHFEFYDDKTSFVLGRLSQVDFVVKEEAVMNEHLSFVRDINGIRLNPLPGCEVAIDGIQVTEPQILSHGCLIALGKTEFVFKKIREDNVLERATYEADHEAANAVSSSPLPEEQEEIPIETKPKYPWLAIFDRIFLMTFLLVLAGASIIVLANVVKLHP